MNAWQRLASYTTDTVVHLRLLIGLPKRRPNSIASGKEQSPRNSPEIETGPPIALAVSEVLDNVTVGDLGDLPQDISERAMIAFLRIIRNPYAVTAEADARWIKFAIVVNRMEIGVK